MNKQEEICEDCLKLKVSIDELNKEIAALRRALISHGEICEMNHALKKENEKFREVLGEIATYAMYPCSKMAYQALGGGE